MTNGKPWSPELERELRDLVAANTSLAVISKKLGKPEEAVRVKIRRLGLEVVDPRKKITVQQLLLRSLFCPRSYSASRRF
jgi:hypothetical protein